MQERGKTKTRDVSLLHKNVQKETSLMHTGE